MSADALTPASPYALAHSPYAAPDAHATRAPSRAWSDRDAVPYRAHRWMMHRARRWGMLQGIVLTVLLIFATRWLLLAMALMAVFAIARRVWLYRSGRAQAWRQARQERRQARHAQRLNPQASLDADPELRAALDASAAEAAHFQAHLRDDARQMADFDRRLREAIDVEPAVAPAPAFAQTHTQKAP